MTAPSIAHTATRIEYCGNLQVHHPIKPMTAAELQVIARDAREQTALFRGRADQARMVGALAGVDK